MSIALTVPAMLTACFLGAWSDKRGRKGPFLFAAIGSSLASLIFLVAIHWELPIYAFMIGKGWLLLISSCVSSCLNWVFNKTKGGGKLCASIHRKSWYYPCPLWMVLCLNPPPPPQYWNHLWQRKSPPWQWFGYQILRSIKFCELLLWISPRVECFIRYPNTSKSVFGYPDETLFRVFYIYYLT